MSRFKTHEEFIKEMAEKNINIDIIGHYQTSRTPIECHCKKCGYYWKSEPRRLSSGQGCPKCAGNIKKTLEVYANEVARGNPNIKIIGKYRNIGSPIKVECTSCGNVWSPKAQTLIQGHGCPVCKNIERSLKARKNHDDFIEQLTMINDDIEVLEKYIDTKTPILCRCKKCDYEWNIRPNNLLNGQGCPHCNCNYKSDEEFKQEMNKKHPEIEVLDNYINNREKLRGKCLLCGDIFYFCPGRILASNVAGCPSCAIKTRNDKITKSQDAFESELSIVNPNITIIGKYVNSHTHIKCLCKKCSNTWETTPTKLLLGSGCPKCNISNGENAICDFLDTNNLEYNLHQKFKGLTGINGGPLSYDFFIPQLNLLIEYQGVQHAKAIDFFGGENQLKIQKEHDARKKKYAINHGYKFLEIWYYEYNDISNILSDYVECKGGAA